jgi:hypothetical protein
MSGRSMGGCACSHSARNRLYSYACPANVDAHWGDIEIPDGGELAVMEDSADLCPGLCDAAS